MPEVTCFDPGSDRGDPSSRLSAAEVAALKGVVSGAGKYGVRRTYPDGTPLAISGGAKAAALLVEPANAAVANWGAGAPAIATVYPVQTTGSSAGKLNAVSRNTDPTATTVAGGAGYSGTPLSRDGLNAMTQVTPDSADVTVIFRTIVRDGSGQSSAGTPAVLLGSDAYPNNLNFGFWLWLPFIPNANVNGSGAPGIQIGLTAVNGGTGGTTLGWNSNQLKEGWNFLKAVDTRNTIAGGSHPLGTSIAFAGDATDPFQSGNGGAVRRVTLRLQGLQGVPVVVGGMWTGLSSTPAVVLGCDASGADLMAYGIPALQAAGIPFYAAVPRSVQSSAYTGTQDRVAVVADYSAKSASLSALIASGAPICNHTMTHVQASASSNMGSLTTPQDIAYEVLAWEAWAKSIGIPEEGHEFYAAPQGSWSRLSEETIKATGTIKMQRCWPQYNTPRTPWGVPNPHNIGSLDFGDQTYAGSYTVAKAVLDVIEVYGDTLFLFWHVIQTAGDTGDTNAKTGNPLNIYQSSFNALVADMSARKAAGRMQFSTPSSWYYLGA